LASLLLGLCLALATPVGAQTMVIADFAEGVGPDWRFFTDRVMGGKSEGQARIDGGALALSGRVSTENNGGFIQVRADLEARLPPDTVGLRLRVRGDGQRYFVHLRSTETRRPWQFYQAGFETGPDWREVTLDLAAFRPMGGGLRGAVEAGQVTSIALVAYGRDHAADVQLSRIEAVRR